MLVRDVVGELELVEGDDLLHPLLPRGRAVRVDVHALRHLGVSLARDDPLAARNSGNVYPRCYTPTDWGIGWALTCYKKAIYSLWRNEWVKGSDNINIGRTSNAAPARLVRFGEPQCRPPAIGDGGIFPSHLPSPHPTKMSPFWWSPLPIAINLFVCPPLTMGEG